MVALAVEILVKQAETLSIADQLLLMARLAENMRQQWRPMATRRKWREIRGIVQAPMMGEDAQAWVSRTRQEGEQERERHGGVNHECSTSPIQYSSLTSCPRFCHQQGEVEFNLPLQTPAFPSL
jgi:hypothetical protein